MCNCQLYIIAVILCLAGFHTRYFIGGGGGGSTNNLMIKRHHPWGSGGMPPLENFQIFGPLRLHLRPILTKISVDKEVFGISEGTPPLNMHW